MFQQIQAKTPINLVVGSLGAGKTTLIKNLLSTKPKEENWAILVNEFGAIGIDGAILESEESSYKIAQIPGGCICCTASEGFQDAIKEVLKTFKPTRVFIEPTGIGEPESMVDMLNNDYFQKHFEIQTTFAVLDSKITKVPQFKQLMIMQNLVDVADVIVFNKTDTADSTNVQELNEFAEALYPPKLEIINTTHSKIDPSLISKATKASSAFSLSLIKQHPSQVHNKTHSHTHIQAPQNETNISLEQPTNPNLKGLIERKSLGQLNTLSLGWIFERETEFDWKRLLNIFEDLAGSKFSKEPAMRSKGVFKIGEPSMLFQWVKEQSVTREFIAYKRDSRLEILLPENSQFDLYKFEQALASAIK